jgi:predicted MPP superfamily phosphohydrolase
MLDDLLKFLSNPKWGRQNLWRTAIWKNMSRLGLTGMHSLPMNQRWVEIHRREMPLKNLDPSLVGFKIVQISDLHYSPVVWQKYLIQYLRWVNEMEPGLVVVTGDLITGGYRFAPRVATLLSHIKSTNGVVCTFGNHDYSIYGKRTNGEGQRRADYLEACLKKRGLIVLRNEVMQLKPQNGGTPVSIVGLDDEWSGNIDPQKAFAGADPNLPTICLNHNPANVRQLLKYPWEWMLSGHTHGRQVAVSSIGRAIYPNRYRHYTHGHYRVGGRHLYVNRGIGYGQRAQHWCRPEITVFSLQREEANG